MTIFDSILEGKKLEKFDWLADEKMLTSGLLKVSLGEVFFLSTGRNAWHSVWSEKYRESGALHSTLSDAKRAAESQRNLGTTFLIEQIPSLTLSSEKISIHCLEIHSKNSFSGIRQENVSNLLAIGTKLSIVAGAFTGPSELYWDSPFPNLDSFVTGKSFYSIKLGPESIEFTGRYASWKSDAQYGSAYLLNWSQLEEKARSPKAIQEIVNIFNSRNSVYLRTAASDLVHHAESFRAAKTQFEDSKESFRMLHKVLKFI